jgi:hypothetical protein
VTPVAFKVMSATIKGGARRGWKRAADAIITESALVEAGVSEDTAEFIMRVVNTGNIDIGSASRELGRIADGSVDSTTDLALRYAAAAGYYSETLTRLIAALSARELNGRNPRLMQYVDTTINQSMFNYSNWATARQIGKTGIAGQMTPVMFSFMNYQMQVTEKLYREVSVAFRDTAVTDTERTQARKFLAAHLVALTTLTGTLGMPFASVVARAAEKLVDLWDDDEEPYDAKAAWRTLLASTFGPGVGEVLSRGVPRLAGIDISTRAGEQDLLPFSRLLTDKRKFADASKDWALQAMGSPVGMLSSIIQGGGMIGSGDLLGGMKQMMPVAIKGPVEAYRMTTEGYVDASGNRLPMSPGASEVLAQAIGFTPAKKAEYNEARSTQANYKAQLSQQASALRRNAAVAVERGDKKAWTDAYAKIQAFDRDNPAFAVAPGLSGAIRQRAKARAQAQATGNPLGTSLKDLNAQRLTKFANFN